MEAERFIAYYRVSTARQGLGLDAQRADVARYLNGRTLLAEFSEKESGRNNHRPELQRALDLCRLTGATLLIAKLDRLSRDVHFLTGLEKAGIEFVACDMPNANRLTVHIMACIAQEERETIAKRTKGALGAIKAEIERTGSYTTKAGQVIAKLGKNNLTPEIRTIGVKAAALVISTKADEFASRVLPIIRQLQNQGMSLRAIADRLNAMQIRAVRGGQWQAVQVSRVLERA
ncbi:recombinase family protein [Azospirillum sp. sgz301742]